jgi:hypothetical protein
MTSMVVVRHVQQMHNDLRCASNVISDTRAPQNPHWESPVTYGDGGGTQSSELNATTVALAALIMQW